MQVMTLPYLRMAASTVSAVTSIKSTTWQKAGVTSYLQRIYMYLRVIYNVFTFI